MDSQDHSRNDNARGQHPSGAPDDARQTSPNITEKEVEKIEERASPRAPIIYEVVRRHGEEELSRPVFSLWWSGVAAGLSLSFSLLAEAILLTRLPDTPWRTLVVALGYSVGFLMVVLARQQLFTENTITAVLPVIANLTARTITQLVRLWGIVFVANLVGTLCAAILCTFTPVLEPDLKDGMLQLSHHIIGHGWLEMVFKSISAGFLIAAMVWLVASTDTAQFSVIVLMTYLIGAGGFMHIIAGSVEAFMLLLHGEVGWWSIVVEFFVPVTIGNIVGGTALFTLIAYAQVVQEL